MERFWKKVIKSDGCWNWIGCRKKQGYGNIRVDGKTVMAHRVSWEMVNGSIPDGLCVLHKCDNPSCVNPDHLFLGTKMDNHCDMVDKGRRASFVGASNGRAKLTQEQVSVVKELYSTGRLTQREIGKLYGVTDVVVSYILSGKIWRSECSN
jgi:hypothetical protein